MAKEKKLTWDVEVDGEMYHVHCETFKTVYDVYVNDELAIRVPKRRDDNGDFEENFKIGSKTCQFVVYDREPDIAVDGVLQGVEETMRRKELRNRLLLIFGGIFTTLVSSFAIFLWYGFRVVGQPIFGGIASLIFMQIFVVGGIVMTFFGLKRKKNDWE